jgi:hypothetical protein
LTSTTSPSAPSGSGPPCPRCAARALMRPEVPHAACPPACLRWLPCCQAHPAQPTTTPDTPLPPLATYRCRWSSAPSCPPPQWCASSWAQASP